MIHLYLDLKEIWLYKFRPSKEVFRPTMKDWLKLVVQIIFHLIWHVMSLLGEHYIFNRNEKSIITAFSSGQPMWYLNHQLKVHFIKICFRFLEFPTTITQRSNIVIRPRVICQWVHLFDGSVTLGLRCMQVAMVLKIPHLQHTSRLPLTFTFCTFFSCSIFCCSSSSSGMGGVSSPLDVCFAPGYKE